MDYLDLTAGDIMFESDDHLLFFVDAMQYCGRDDARHRALFYCLGIESAVRAHIEDVYGFEENEIRLECLQCAWMEERYAKVVRMAFNLYGSGMLDGELPEYDFRRYTPDDLFCCSYGPYFWEAVRIRYPEYCLWQRGGRNNGNNREGRGRKKGGQHGRGK